MIDGIEGIPGSGKGYEATVFHVLAAVKAKRLVITNLALDLEAFERILPGSTAFIEMRITPQPIRGRWDAKAIGTDKPIFVLFEDGHTEDPPETAMPFGGVWDFHSEWKREDGRGPLYVIDECHVGMPTIGTDKQVLQWFKMHRHFNADVLLMTQSFRDMDQSIARLIRTLVKVRAADVIGKEGSYIRKVHSGYRGGLVSEEVRPYKPEFFGLWKSHTQGAAVAEEKVRDVKPLAVKIKYATRVTVAIGLALTVWAWWPSGKASEPAKTVKDKQWYKEAQARAGQPMTFASETPALAASGPQQAQHVPTMTQKLALGTREEPTSTDGSVPEPYGPKGLHMQGRLTLKGRTIYMLTVSQNGAVVSSVTSADLEQVGYKFRALSDCVATVQWGKLQRVLVCDSPSITVANQPRSGATTTAAVAGSGAQ